jgi:hypothetical protein
MPEKKPNWHELLLVLAATQSSLREILRRDMEAFEKDLKEVVDDAQLANLDLQNLLQKQQQTLQLLSNITKLQQDTAMAIIRNLGG